MGLGSDIEIGFAGFGDGSLGFVGMGRLLGSLLVWVVAVGLGEGLDFWAADELGEGLDFESTAVVAEEEDSQRDLRWWEWAEEEG